MQETHPMYSCHPVPWSHPRKLGWTLGKLRPGWPCSRHLGSKCAEGSVVLQSSELMAKRSHGLAEHVVLDSSDGKWWSQCPNETCLSKDKVSISHYIQPSQYRSNVKKITLKRDRKNMGVEWALHLAMTFFLLFSNHLFKPAMCLCKLRRDCCSYQKKHPKTMKCLDTHLITFTNQLLPVCSWTKRTDENGRITSLRGQFATKHRHLECQ